MGSIKFKTMSIEVSLAYTSSVELQVPFDDARIQYVVTGELSTLDYARLQVISSNLVSE